MAILMEDFNKISEENLPEKPSSAKTVNWKRSVGLGQIPTLGSAYRGGGLRLYHQAGGG